MKKLFHSFKETSLRKRTILFLVLSAILFIISASITLNNNIPRLIGLLLAIISCILAFIHHWNQPKYYIFLAAYTIIIFTLSVILHNICEHVAQNYISHILLSNIVNSIGVAFFFVAILFCPAAFIIGVIGSLFLFLKNKFLRNKNDYK